MLILRSPDDAAGSGSNKVKVDTGKAATLPADVAGMKFNVEQMPELAPEEGYQPPAAKEEVKEEPKKKEEPKEETVVKEPETKKEEPKKEEKETEKQEEEVVEEVESVIRPPKGKEGETKKSDADKAKFDYSGFSDSEVTALKNMSNESRQFTAALIKESKELAKLKDGQFYQHADGYQLHPAYQEEVKLIGLADQESRLWARALTQIKAGKPFRPVTGWDKDGKPIFGAEMIDKDGTLEEQVRQSMNNCNNIVQQKRGQVQQFVTNFKANAEKDTIAIRNKRAELFSWVKDPKQLDFEIHHPDGVETVRQVRDNVINLFPPYMRNTEGVQACGDLMVSLKVARAEIEVLKGTKKVTQVKKEEKAAIEPNGSVKSKKAASAPVHGVKNFSTEGAGIEI